jgi:hypothetical protein
MTATAGARRFPRPSAGTLGLALVVAGLLAASLSLSRIAGWIPRGVLSLTLALLVVQIALEIREQLRNAPAAPPPGANAATATTTPASAATPGEALLWMGGLLLAVLLLGTTAGTTLFAFAYLRWYAGESWPTSGVFALVLGVCIQLVFGLLLQATLYPGWLWQFTRYDL